MSVGYFGPEVAFCVDPELFEPAGDVEAFRRAFCYGLDAWYFWEYFFLVDFVPVFGAFLASVGGVAIFVFLAGVEDVEDEFGVDVAAGGALSDVGVGLVVLGFEVYDALGGVAVVDGVSAGVEDEHFVEHLVDVGRGLVDDDEHEFAFEGEFSQEVHYVLGVAAGEAGCGFVDEEDARFSDEFEGDVESFALASGDHFIKRGAYLEVFALV